MPFRYPNLFLVGAPKCGTTWMASCLGRHPEIYFSSKKEPLTLATDLEHRQKFDWARYKALFEDAQGERYVAEGSVWYLYSEAAAQEIERITPDARIIIMIREPIDMIRSLHRQFVKTGNEPILQLERALAAEPERREGVFLKEAGHFPLGLLYTEVVRYSRQINKFIETFGKDRVHVILYNDLVASPEKTAKGVFDFLGLTPMPVDPTPENVGGHFYAFGSRKINRHLNKILKRHSRLKSLIPPGMRAKLRQLSQYLSRYDGTIKPETSESLQARFVDERTELEHLLERDLSSWNASANGPPAKPKP